ncbi:MAG TPA: hypothetical protein VEB65_13300 [Solirubrobacterales bacterium]|nr:hypothetical protein [Solirubrobacterales bacterium]
MSPNSPYVNAVKTEKYLAAQTECLVDLVVPPKGTTCGGGRQQFDPEFGQPLPQIGEFTCTSTPRTYPRWRNQMNAIQANRRSRPRSIGHRRVSRGALAILLGLVLTGSLLLSAGPASAASRGFKLENKSSLNLQLVAAKPVPAYKCIDPGRCIPTNHPMDFEGRPANGSMLNAGGTDVWELKYNFSLIGGVQYAADLWYRILGTDDQVHYRIEVYSTSNESYCDIVGTKKYGCVAEGTRLEFKNQGAG